MEKVRFSFAEVNRQNIKKQNEIIVKQNAAYLERRRKEMLTDCNEFREFYKRIAGYIKTIEECRNIYGEY